MSANHEVTIEFEAQSGWYTPTLTFRCHAPKDAGCRTECRESGCEEGCNDPDNHVRTSIDYCNFEEWMDATESGESCIIGKRTSITAPIEIKWGGTCDGPDWRFADVGSSGGGGGWYCIDCDAPCGTCDCPGPLGHGSSSEWRGGLT